MTFAEHHHLDGIDGQSADRAARPANAGDHPAFGRHYRIAELAQMWNLGRETVRLLIKDEQGVIKVRRGRKKTHTIYRCLNPWQSESTRDCSTAASEDHPTEPSMDGEDPVIPALDLHVRTTRIQCGGPVSAARESSDSGYLPPPEIPTGLGFSL
jgi:hypothetical protein